MAFANAAISDIIATTIQHRNKTIADNVTKNNALLTYSMSRRGNIRTVSGGNTILEELSFAANGNAGFYSGYETLPIAAQDVISAAEYQWKQAACPVTISGLEQLMNSGPERMIDLLESRISVAESSMSNLIAISLYGDGTGSGGKEIDGLAKQVATDPTAGCRRGHRPGNVAVLAQQDFQGHDHGWCRDRRDQHHRVHECLVGIAGAWQ